MFVNRSFQIDSHAAMDLKGLLFKGSKEWFFPDDVQTSNNGLLNVCCDSKSVSFKVFITFENRMKAQRDCEAIEEELKYLFDWESWWYVLMNKAVWAPVLSYWSFQRLAISCHVRLWWHFSSIIPVLPHRKGNLQLPRIAQTPANYCVVILSHTTSVFHIF